MWGICPTETRAVSSDTLLQCSTTQWCIATQQAEFLHRAWLTCRSNNVSSTATQQAEFLHRARLTCRSNNVSSTATQQAEFLHRTWLTCTTTQQAEFLHRARLTCRSNNVSSTFMCNIRAWCATVDTVTVLLLGSDWRPCAVLVVTLYDAELNEWFSSHDELHGHYAAWHHRSTVVYNLVFLIVFTVNIYNHSHMTQMQLSYRQF